MKDLKDLYRTTPVPPDLESLVKDAIGRQEKRVRRSRAIRTSWVFVLVLVLSFAGVVNFSPLSAQAMAGVPVLGNLARLVTFAKLTYDDGLRGADVNVPEIQGPEGEFTQALNKEYLERNSELFARFVEGYDEDEWTPLFLTTNFQLKATTENLFVVEHIVTEIGASAKESVRYDNIDLANQMVLTLPSLFKDDSYVPAITENIVAQMREQMEGDQGYMYFILGEGPVSGGFREIDPEQTFYVNSEHKLVIVVDEYDVAPGFMGIVEFQIPTDLIQDLLIGDTYIR